MDRGAVGSPYWNKPASQVLAEVGARITGLTQAEAAERLKRDGPNVLEAVDHAGPLRLLLRQFGSPLVLILVFASLVAFGLRDWTEASIILAIVLGSTALGFSQEYEASRAVDALKRRLALSSRVIREGREQTIPAADVVVGDIVLLSAGNLVPADGLILKAQDFLVTEASLTGESFPVEKSPGVTPANAGISERWNCAFAGGSVRSGQARIVALATGRGTLFGSVAARLRSQEPETAFVRGLRSFGYLLVRVMVVLVIFVLIINQLLGRPFFESLLYSVALAVGLSPELLPAIVSVTLAAGARKLARGGVLVRRLDAIENLGGVDILCTDKTGTLTEGVVALDGAVGPDGQVSDQVFRLAFLNAALETGIENPLDAAIVAAGARKGLDASSSRKVDEIPYDFQRKRLTIVIDDGDPSSRLIITKGAFDQIMAICTRITTGGEPVAMDDAMRAALEARYRDYGSAGVRALALATRRAPLKDDYVHDDEADMAFEGFLAFADPPKTDARATLASLASAGLKIKIITGDNRYVAGHVAEAMGLDPAQMLRGADIDAIKSDALPPLVEQTQVFAEIEPQQKERIVRALQRNGHAVAFLGDGVNDAPALRAADVGISVDGAVDVAREAADIILLERDLGVLKQGIENGRRTFVNTMKYVSITTGSSFGNMVSMALATPFLPFLPLTATQVLLTNFLTDLPLMAITTDNVDPERVEAPQRWSVKGVESFMLVFGLLSSAFDLMLFYLLAAVFRTDEATFQTAWFILSVLTELLALLILRTRRLAWASQPGGWLIWLSVLVAAIVATAPYIPLVAGPLGLEPPKPLVILSALAVVLAYAAATQAANLFIFRRNRTSPHA